MRIVDLFSGAGGLTFGFYYKTWGNRFVRNRHNEIVFANEYDKKAAEAYQANYPDVNMRCCDIKQLTDEDVCQMIGDVPIDLLIGGPPCQSFSTVGKRQFDDKAKLYTEYLRVLKTVYPKMFLFENVKGILSMHEQIPDLNEDGSVKLDDNGKEKKKDGRLLMDILKEEFGNIGGVGYEIVGEETLDAQYYGIPQHRERVFIVGVRKDLTATNKWQYPPKTHGGDKKPVLSIRDAISDLPSLNEGEAKQKYTVDPQNDYQKLMRGKCTELSLHYCGRHNEKLRRIIAAVPQGKGRSYINELVEKGELPGLCELTSGYENTYGRLVESVPATTITNNMCTPSALRCIHYGQNRELSPREGARIQSFPDWFTFAGERTNVTRQIGNAVPPLLAILIARQIEKTLEGLKTNEQG